MYVFLIVLNSFIISNTRNQDFLQNSSYVHSSKSVKMLSDKKTAEITLKNGIGTLEINNNDPSLIFEEREIAIPNFDYYKVFDDEGNFRYFIADTLNERLISNDFACIILYYLKEENSYIMNIQFAEVETYIFYNLMVNVTDAQLEFFNGISTEFAYCGDDLSVRLRESQNIYNQVYCQTDQEYLSTKSSNRNGIGAQTFSATTPAHLKYDVFTSQDGILQNYKNEYLGRSINPNYLSDDYIVKIIPKELFTTLGNHSYIGKEYGFYVNTIWNSNFNNGYSSDVFVFDIVNSKPTLFEYSTMILPLFSYRYRSILKGYVYNWDSHYDPTENSQIFLDVQYDAPEFFLKDVSFKHTLANANALNPGDSGYVNYNDTGEFFIQSRFNCSGVGLKKKNKDFTFSQVKFGLGYIPIVGNVLSIVEHAAETFEDIISGNYQSNRDINVYNNEANIWTTSTTWDAQLGYNGSSYPGNYTRKINIAPITDSTKPLLIGVGNYAQSIYLTSRKQTTSTESDHITGITAKVCIDNTSKVWFVETGSLDVVCSIKGVASKSNFERKLESINYQNSDFIKLGGGVFYQFKPLRSGEYTFESEGTNDTYLHLFDSLGNQISYNDDGGNGYNAKLVYNLEANRSYYVKLRLYSSSKSGDTFMTIKYGISGANLITLNNPVRLNVESYKYSVYKFIPSYTMTHEIITSNNIGDPYLELLDSTGKRITFNDDGGGSSNSRILIMLYAGETYYIIARSFSPSSSSTFDLSIRGV